MTNNLLDESIKKLKRKPYIFKIKENEEEKEYSEVESFFKENLKCKYIPQDVIEFYRKINGYDTKIDNIWSLEVLDSFQKNLLLDDDRFVEFNDKKELVKRYVVLGQVEAEYYVFDTMQDSEKIYCIDKSGKISHSFVNFSIFLEERYEFEKLKLDMLGIIEIYKENKSELQENPEMLAQFFISITKFECNRDLNDVLTWALIGRRDDRKIFQNNIEFWAKMREEGLLKGRLDCAKFKFSDEYRKFMFGTDSELYSEDRKKFILENIDRITPNVLQDWILKRDTLDREFMLTLIKRDPEYYFEIYDTLRDDSEFIEQVKLVCPEIQKVIEDRGNRIKEEERLKKEQQQLEKEEEQKEYDEKIKKIYMKLGDSHPNFMLVNNFLESNASQKVYCQRNNITEHEFRMILEEVGKVYPEIKEQIMNKNQRASAIYLSAVEEIISKLLSGEMSLLEYSSKTKGVKTIDELLRQTKTPEENEQLKKILINNIAIEDLKMMNYVRLFSNKYDYKNTMVNFENFVKDVTKLFPELNGKNKPINIVRTKMRELKKFERPFMTKDFLGSSKGVRNTKTGEMEMTEITQEHIDYAKEYLKLEDEYICYNTVNTTISKLVKGELSKEEIDRKSGLSDLERKEEQLQELIKEEEKTRKEMQVAKAVRDEYQEKTNEGESIDIPE